MDELSCVYCFLGGWDTVTVSIEGNKMAVVVLQMKHQKALPCLYITEAWSSLLSVKR